MAETSTDARTRHLVLLAAAPTITIELLNGFYLEPAYRFSPSLFWALDLLQFVVVPLVSLWALAKFGRVRPRDFGLRRFGKEYDFISLGILFFYVTVAFIVSYKLGIIFGPNAAWLPPSKFGYGYAISRIPELKPALVLYLALTASFVEEIMFRGLPFLYLSKFESGSRFFRTYILASSVLFGLVHWENGLREVFAAFVVGVCAAFIYTKIQNLWPLVVAHAATDVVGFW